MINSALAVQLQLLGCVLLSWHWRKNERHGSCLRGERHQFYNHESYNKNNNNQYRWLQIATILQKWPPINTGTLCTFPLRVWENVENWLICIITVPFACFFEGVRLIFTAALSLSLQQLSRKNSSPVFLFTNILFNFAKIVGNKVYATSNTNVNGSMGQIASLNL